MIKYLCIACEVLARPIYLSSAHSPFVIDIELIEFGLHHQPEKLQKCIQSHIEGAENRGYEAILLGYGLCGNGTAGLKTLSTQLVIPRVHDCISLLLGGSQRFLEQFDNHPGTYWYTQDFLDRADLDKFSSMGLINDDDLAKQYDSFIVKYGRDNAYYLMEVMGGWQSHYTRAAFIETGITNINDTPNRIREAARKRGWTFEMLAGDLVLFRQLLNGEWFSKSLSSFIVIPPYHVVDLSYDQNIYKCSQNG